MPDLDEQIAWVDREIEFKENDLSIDAQYDDDLPILKGILESLHRLQSLER